MGFQLSAQHSVVRERDRLSGCCRRDEVRGSPGPSHDKGPQHTGGSQRVITCLVCEPGTHVHGPLPQTGRSAKLAASSSSSQCVCAQLQQLQVLSVSVALSRRVASWIPGSNTSGVGVSLSKTPHPEQDTSPALHG